MGSNISTVREKSYLVILAEQIIKEENKLEVLLDFKKVKDEGNEVDQILDKEISKTKRSIEICRISIELTKAELKRQRDEMHYELDQQLM